MSRTLFFCGLLLFLCAGALGQDIVSLHDGRTIEGTITSESDDEVVIETKAGTRVIAIRDVRSIERRGAIEDEFARRLQSLGKWDVEGYLELAAWCELKEHPEGARRCYQTVIGIDPDHRLAREALGFRRYDDEWLNERDYKFAIGWVEIEGELVPPDVAQKIRMGLVYVDGEWVEPVPDTPRPRPRPRPDREEPADEPSEQEQSIEHLRFPRTLKETYAGLKEVLAGVGQKDAEAGFSEPQIRSVRLLNAYRFLTGVPHDVVLDAEHNRFAQAGAQLCERIGRLDHTPANPGMAEDAYQEGYKGTSSSNLAQGVGLPAAVDMWMDDSDPSNIDRIGHRRWCLNPRMTKTGFGISGIFTAMWAMDQGRSLTAETGPETIAFPPHGYMPVKYFSSTWAWNVSYDASRLSANLADLDIKVYPLPPGKLKNLKKRGAPLELQDVAVETTRFGYGPAIIFKPVRYSIGNDCRYLVEIDGLKRVGSEEPVPLQYIVEFAR